MVIPQILLCGLFVPRDQLPRRLEVISDVLPLSYAVDAMQKVASSTQTGDVWGDVLVVSAYVVARARPRRAHPAPSVGLIDGSRACGQGSSRASRGGAACSGGSGSVVEVSEGWSSSRIIPSDRNSSDRPREAPFTRDYPVRRTTGAGSSPGLDKPRAFRGPAARQRQAHGKVRANESRQHVISGARVFTKQRMFRPIAALASLLAATGMCAIASPAEAVGPGVCTGITTCRVVARVDVDGNGTRDPVALSRLGKDGGPHGTVVIRAKVGRHRVVQARRKLPYWYGPVWQGAAFLDGRKGRELVVGHTAGAHSELSGH